MSEIKDRNKDIKKLECEFNNYVLKFAEDNNLSDKEARLIIHKAMMFFI